MRKRRFKVKVDAGKCPDPIGCRKCLVNCPQSVFVTHPEKPRSRDNKVSRWVITPAFATVCHGCLACVPLCPAGAISVKR